MIVTFEETYLRDLYVKGTCSDKKHRYQPGVVKGYKKGIDYLKWATRKEDLFRINSLHFEALVGDKRGRFYIKADYSFRVEFTIKETDEEPILTICNIVELSNHYE